MLKHFKWLGLYTKNGNLQQFLCGTVGREQDSEAKKCMGSNHGVNIRLVG